MLKYIVKRVFLAIITLLIILSLIHISGEIGVEAGELAGWLLGGQEKLGSAGREGE